jgi:hypothetical protein
VLPTACFRGTIDAAEGGPRRVIATHATAPDVTTAGKAN